MKTFTVLTASAILTLLIASTATAHDPDEMLARFPAAKKEAAAPKTCAELHQADRHTLNQKDPSIQALEKRCKAETAATAKKPTQTKKSKDDAINQ